MMKMKYERLNKLEKKELLLKFKEDKEEIYKKIRKMITLCIIGLIYGVLVFIYDIIINNSNISIILDIFVFIVSLYGFIKVYKTKIHLLNNYLLIKNNKKK